MSALRITIRDYTRADRAHLVRCMDALQDHMVSTDPWRRLTRTSSHGRMFAQKYLKEVQEKSGFVLVAQVNDEPAGVAVAWEHQITGPERTTELPTRAGFLCDLSVLPKWRGRGVGTRLLEETERRFRAAGCDQMTLGVFFHNLGARRLYDRRGFSVRGMFLSKQLGPPKRRWPLPPPRPRKKRL